MSAVPEIRRAGRGTSMLIYPGGRGPFRPLPAKIAGMRRPAQCRCGDVYDLDRVTVTGRFAECSEWRTPCCGREADDRNIDGAYTELPPVPPEGGDQ
jgi:hypothetical protein